MDSIELKRYEERLLKRKSEIVTIAKHLEEEKHDVTGQQHFDWLDQARDENQGRLLDRLNQTYLQEGARVEMALARILAGTYGLCVACYQPIEKRRLDIFPDTEFCLRCQEIRDRFARAA